MPQHISRRFIGRTVLTLLSSVLATIALAAPALADAPVVTLEDAVKLAETRTPTVYAAEAGADAAQAQLNQAWSARLPSLSASGNVLVYPEEQSFELAPGVDVVVREQVTSSISARATLPLTGQFAIDRQVAAAKANRDAGRSSVDSAVLDARWRAEDAWYAALQAERQLANAQAQEGSLATRVRTAQATHAAGALTRNDLLLAELALAQAKQGVLQLEAGRDAAYGALGLAIGTTDEPARPGSAPAEAPSARADVDALSERAVGARPDLVALRHRVDAARASAAAQSWSRLPSVSAMAVYQHAEGNGLFGEPDTMYAGATLDWTVWAWGRAAAGVRAANAGATQIAAQLDAAEAGARLEVRTRARSLAAAVAGWEVAKGSIAQAEENLKIQAARQEAGSGTMQEVLDAEVTLLRARSNEATALTDAWRANAALERAVGGE
ncbi:MAG: TolC family protein [Pseudomonadota bacterium]|nr:TolC family protein [Pseudomonadota bacterium]